MGMSKTVEYAGPVPTWKAVREASAAAGLALAIRMIDNLPAFPDEEPEEGWRELRVSSARGMLTIRRHESALELVVWGNADGDLQADWARLAEILQSKSVGS